MDTFCFVVDSTIWYKPLGYQNIESAILLRNLPHIWNACIVDVICVSFRTMIIVISGRLFDACNKRIKRTFQPFCLCWKIGFIMALCKWIQFPRARYVKIAKSFPIECDQICHQNSASTPSSLHYIVKWRVFTSFFLVYFIQKTVFFLFPFIQTLNVGIEANCTKWQ